MSEPLDTTPCRRPSASSTNGTLASLRGRAGGITRAVLDFSQSANGASPSPRRTAAPQWRDAAEHTRDHRQDDDADVELTVDPSSHAGPGSRPARLCGVTRDRQLLSQRRSIRRWTGQARPLWLVIDSQRSDLAIASTALRSSLVAFGPIFAHAMKVVRLARNHKISM